jgi:ligand-binding SRPBCC domain-containing protein
LRGMFKSFEHDHYFDLLPDGSTLMRDELRFAAPLGLLGRIAEMLVLRGYLAHFLKERNLLIQRVAESPAEGWLPYIQQGGV